MFKIHRQQFYKTQNELNRDRNHGKLFSTIADAVLEDIEDEYDLGTFKDWNKLYKALKSKKWNKLLKIANEYMFSGGNGSYYEVAEIDEIEIKTSRCSVEEIIQRADKVNKELI